MWFGVVVCRVVCHRWGSDNNEERREKKRARIDCCVCVCDMSRRVDCSRSNDCVNDDHGTGRNSTSDIATEPPVSQQQAKPNTDTVDYCLGVSWQVCQRRLAAAMRNQGKASSRERAASREEWSLRLVADETFMTPATSTKQNKTKHSDKVRKQNKTKCCRTMSTFVDNKQATTTRRNSPATACRQQDNYAWWRWWQEIRQRRQQ